VAADSDSDASNLKGCAVYMLRSDKKLSFASGLFAGLSVTLRLFLHGCLQGIVQNKYRLRLTSSSKRTRKNYSLLFVMYCFFFLQRSKACEIISADKKNEIKI
jgi:hypothetical protein